jgi:hypothetical protein
MTYDGVARAITDTTRSTVGVPVSPHLFRTSVASSAAIHGGALSRISRARCFITLTTVSPKRITIAHQA